MSKKFGKFLLFSAVAGAAAYGVYSYLQKKEQEVSTAGADDADDDYDDFSEDLDEEPAPTKVRSYVSLNLDKAEAIATEAFHKAKEVITDSVNQVRETVKSVTESQSSAETNFTDLTALQKEADAQKEETPSDAGQSNASAPSDSQADGVTAPGSSKEAADDAGTGKMPSPENTDGPAPEKKAAPGGQVEEFFDDTPQ